VADDVSATRFFQVAPPTNRRWWVNAILLLVAIEWENQSESKGKIARLRVDSETKSHIPVCKAVVTYLEANSRTLVSGVQLPLLFTPAQSPGANAKPVRHGQSEYLELLWISNSSGNAEIMTNFPFAFTEYKTLHRLSAYSLGIAFSVDERIINTVIDAAYTSDVWMLSIRSPRPEENIPILTGIPRGTNAINGSKVAEQFMLGSPVANEMPFRTPDSGWIDW
jgi:hypothetical protein